MTVNQDHNVPEDSREDDGHANSSQPSEAGEAIPHNARQGAAPQPQQPPLKIDPLTHAEQHRQRELLQKIFDTIPVMLVLWNPQLKQFQLNRHAEDVLGWTTHEANAGDFLQMVYPDPRTRAEVAAFMQSLTTDWREFCPVRQDGDCVPSEWANIRLTDDTRVGIGVDLRQQKAAEAALAESERLYRTLATYLPGGAAFLIDRDLRYVLAQGEALRPAGFTSNDLEGLTISEALGAETAARHEPYVRLALAGEPYEVEHENHGRHFVSRGVPIRDDTGQITHVLGLSFDITARKRAEEALERLNETLEEQVAERTSMLALVNDVATVANEARTFAQALEYTLRRVSEHNGWSFGHAYLLNDADTDRLIPVRTFYEDAPGRFQAFQRVTLGTPLERGQGLPGRAWARRSIEWTKDVQAELAERRAELGDELGILTGAAFPILARDEVVGVLEFFSDKAIERSPRLLESMESIGTLLGRVVERERFERELARGLLVEQQRVGQDLHDGVGQQLAGLALLAERMQRDVRNGRDVDAGLLAELTAGLRKALDETRIVVRGLLPPPVHGAAFTATLEQMAQTIAERFGVACEMVYSEPVTVAAPDVTVQLYRIAVEAMTNAAKHANARKIVVELRMTDHVLTLEVRDDGIGLPDDAERRSSGLRIMRHRAKVIGGTLDIAGREDGGTAVRCVLPRDRLLGRAHEDR